MCVGVALFLAATTVACSRGETARSGATEGSSAAADVATALESPAGAQSGEPFLFTDARGKVLMTWLEKRGDSRYALRFSALSGNEWSTPTTIAERNDFFVNWADFPSVVRTESGRLVAHWLQKSGSSKYAYDVRISQSIDDGRSWSPGSVLNRDGVQAEHGFVALWPSEGDRVGAAWLDGRASLAKDTTQRATHVMTTSISADGTLGAESTLDTRTCDCCQVAVAVASRGPIVAYRDRTSDETRDIVVTRRVNGKWSEPALVHHDDWKIAACPVNGPALSARGDTVVIAWFTGAQDSARVRFARSVDGGTTFGAPTR
ncbi:MAG: sialidase family protein, partial [Gemmatimonadaceae bacterium]